MHHLIETLTDYGLSNKEAKVYLWCLELGAAPASTVARRINEKRVTVYANLKSLCAKGIATEAKKQKVSYFSVIQPDILLHNFERKMSNFKKNMPDLLAVSSIFGNALKTQFFEWFEWIKHLYLDQLHSQTDLYSFISATEAKDQLKDFFYNEYIPARSNKNIFARKILRNGPESEKFAANDTNAFRKSLLVDALPIGEAQELLIYGPDKICIALFGEDQVSGILIHSKQLYTTLKGLFMYIWEKEGGEEMGK